MTEKVGKVGVFRWQGVLAGRDKGLRLMVAVFLAIACTSLTFVQLGFAGIGFPGDYVAYAVVLLLPIAVGALLLGTGMGFAFGLFAGIVLYAHAALMPIDFYEMSFVTPVTSIIMLSIAGFLLGLLFALALRRGPGRPKRLIYIAIVCISVSWLYSIFFVTTVAFQMAIDFVNSGVADTAGADFDAALQEKATTMALRLGNTDIQAWGDAALMAVVCCVADYLTELAIKSVDRRRLRPLFGVWLAVVFIVAFMITGAASFVAISEGEKAQAFRTLESEVNYLCTQMNESQRRDDSVYELVNSFGKGSETLTDDQVESLTDAVSADALLKGYTLEDDGIILITYGEEDYILMTDDPRFKVGKSTEEYLESDVREAIDSSVATGQVERVIYDEGWSATREYDPEDETVTSYLAYLLASEADGATVVMIMPSSMVYANRGIAMATTSLSSVVLLLVVFVLVSRLLNRLIVRRVDEINGVLGRITDGDLDARVDVRDTLEFSSLSTDINETVVALKGWIAEAETRMDAELATARAIQESALPRIFPPYPDILRFDVYAMMHPAREVGGDFYDFFLIGADSGQNAGKLGFVVADVSGKGVPAALFMMKAKALIRGYLESGMQPGEAAENANRKLCDGNDAGMFVTLWAGVLDYGSNHVDFVNAGHNPPLFWQDGEWRWLKEKSGLPLGLFEGLPYNTYGLDCQIGDQFLIYTDGVTEAMSVEGELFGEERLEKLACANYDLHPRVLIEKVRRGVAMHANGAEQSDDITILALEVGVPPEITATLTVPADVDALPRVNEFVHTELDRRLCPLRIQNQLDIAVEELFVNEAHYAYPDATPDNPGTVQVSYTYSAEPPSITVDLMDKGIPYDPLAKPDAETPDNIMDVPIGGLGILMAKRSVDEMRYAREDGSNIVTIVKKW